MDSNHTNASTFEKFPPAVATSTETVSTFQSVESDHETSLSASIFTAQQQREQRLRGQRQRALKSVTKYNTFINQQRVSERKNYFDLQTNLVHVPRRTVQVLPTDSELYQLQLVDSRRGTGPHKRVGSLRGASTDIFSRKTGAYPASLMFSPPQYSDHVPIFSSKELGYLPLSTVVHSAPPFAVHCLNMSAEEFRKMRGLDGKEGEFSDEESDLGEAEDTIEIAENGLQLPGKTLQNEEKGGNGISSPEKLNDRRPTAPNGRSRGAKKDLDVSFEGATETPSTPQEDVEILDTTVELPVEIPVCPPNTCSHCHWRSHQPAPGIPVGVAKSSPKKRSKRPPPELTAADLAKEKLIGCSKCSKKLHPSCMHVSKAALFCMQKYSWQCSDCKICLKCSSPDKEEKLMFCDLCDRGYHNYCVGVQRIPHGRWLCGQCAVCSLCAATRPNADGKRGRACIWQLDWDEDDSGSVTAVRTLCYPCHKKKKGIKANDVEENVDEDSKSNLVLESDS